MPVPDFQSMMLPVLRIFGDGKEHSLHEILDTIATEFKLTPEEMSEFISSGRQTRFYNRVGWARTYLTKSGLLQMTRRGHYMITTRGEEVLQSNPKRIDMKFLEQFPEYIDFRKDNEKEIAPVPNAAHRVNVVTAKTPEEALEDAYLEIRNNLAREILAYVKDSPPEFFEKLVVELLVKMGYGGSQQEAARAIGRPGDEGIDGIIDEDRLGLDSIYIQAKRWDAMVGRPEIQKFVGALMGKRAHKGIFITTSDFSADAIKYVASIDYRIALIDGKRLADFMIDNDIGVTQLTSYSLKRIDSDYFNM